MDIEVMTAHLLVQTAQAHPPALLRGLLHERGFIPLKDVQLAPGIRGAFYRAHNTFSLVTRNLDPYIARVILARSLAYLVLLPLLPLEEQRQVSDACFVLASSDVLTLHDTVPSQPKWWVALHAHWADAFLMPRGAIADAIRYTHCADCLSVLFAVPRTSIIERAKALGHSIQSLGSECVEAALVHPFAGRTLGLDLERDEVPESLLTQDIRLVSSRVAG